MGVGVGVWGMGVGVSMTTRGWVPSIFYMLSASVL